MIYLNQEKEKIFSKKKIPDYYFNTHFENPEKEAPQKRSLFLALWEVSPEFYEKSSGGCTDTAAVSKAGITRDTVGQPTAL
ncbi:hypothetical protein [[Clostridium] aminophilum]|uniref:hypothetical protein n=1 Tax=[Clostridium] aminophilum TaxID=1526 RepID=UPI003329CE5C